MAKKKGGLISRILIGSEKSEGYARASLPSNRWELFWDIFKSKFWKLVLINLIMLLFFIPLIALFVIKWLAEINMGTYYPFNQVFGIGYQAPYSLVGINESITFNLNSSFFALMPIVLIIAFIGISGGAYIIRNMVWQEGVFISNDFWHGVKVNIKKMIIIALLFSVVFYVTVLFINLANLNIANGVKNKWLYQVSKVMSYMILIFYSFMTLHMITMTTTYELKIKDLIKNSFLFTIGLLPQNIFFVVLGLIPVALTLMGGFFTVLGLPSCVLFGVSLFLLVWTDFCQWSYDKFINDKVSGAKKNRGIYEKVKDSDSKTFKQYKGQVEYSKSTLTSRPIKPITDEELKLEELPQVFNRNDIMKLEQSKQMLKEDNEKYIEEHKKEFNGESTDEKEEIERLKRIEKAKKELSKRQ
ncbi:MAG: hypothetical protein MJ066_03685 [Clostridia bacterium]|nr:hypothetical protein [Clostridia bacterium]